MAVEITHQPDEDGVMRQIVTAERLAEILRADGDDLSRPAFFADEDEWFVDSEDEE